MPHVLALDQGTSSSRAIVFDARGRKLGAAQKELAQHFPQPGWVEHDAEEIWETALGSAREALKEAGLRAGELAAIGITNQRETIVLWDRETGRPVHRAIVWQDRRTASAMDRMRAAGNERVIRRKTGLVLDPYFSGSKLRWLLDHVPGARKKAAAGRLAAGTVDSWLVSKLTGGRDARDRREQRFAHDADEPPHRRSGTPSCAGSFPSRRGCFPRSFRAAAGSRRPTPESSARACPSPESSATSRRRSSASSAPGPASRSAPTARAASCSCSPDTRPVASRNRLLTTVAWRIGEGPMQYALEGSVFSGGAAIQWLRDGLKIIPSAPDVNALAASVEDSGGVVVVPAFTGLGAPEWDATARGAILGLTRGSTAAHLARATLEGIAFQVADLLNAMEADTGTRLRELRVDGGAAASDLLMQIQADLSGVRVARPENLETTAQGAAFMAGLAVGVWPDLAALAKTWRVERTFASKMPRRESRRRRALWRRAVERARHWDVG